MVLVSVCGELLVAGVVELVVGSVLVAVASGGDAEAGGVEDGVAFGSTTLTVRVAVPVRPA